MPPNFPSLYANSAIISPDPGKFIRGLICFVNLLNHLEAMHGNSINYHANNCNSNGNFKATNGKFISIAPFKHKLFTKVQKNHK